MSSPWRSRLGQDEAGTEKHEGIQADACPQVRLRGKMLLFNVLISPECGLYTWHQDFWQGVCMAGGITQIV